jgi:hypothetical protein
MIRTRETAARIATQLALTPATVPVAQSDLLAAQLEQLPRGAVALVVNHGGPSQASSRSLAHRPLRRSRKTKSIGCSW